MKNIFYKIAYIIKYLFNREVCVGENGYSFQFQKRQFIAHEYLSGNGIEIGALNNPLSVSSHAHVQYVDYMSIENLRKHYPELSTEKIVIPDIIDNGEKLSKIKSNSQDFVIANHYLEHCRNPIGAIENMLRVLKTGGVIYLAIPDKRHTFDNNRNVTGFDHIYDDYIKGPDISKEGHYRDWLMNVEKIKKMEIDEKVKYYTKKDMDIHFHTWTQAEMFELLALLRIKMDFRFEVLLAIQNQNGFENIFIIKKEK